jgi:predicted glycoside hydrolase/deacetylase ChbG (UPF0249 family)
MGRLLIVNADDYGLAPAVSAGIRQAHQQGLVTSTTAMMNMQAAGGDLRAAQADCPELGLGVHLVLTAGCPVLPPGQVASLVHLGGGERFPPLAAFVEHLGDLDVEEVRAEWRAQIERFVAATGLRPTHLDSHHHTSYFSGALFRAMLDLASEYGAAIRMPITTAAAAQAILGLPAGSDRIQQALTQVKQVFGEARGQRHPDHFEARFYGEQATVETLRRIVATLPEGSTEIMCHPSLADPALDALTSYGSRLRARELEALTDRGLRQNLAAAGVTLSSFAGV